MASNPFSAGDASPEAKAKRDKLTIVIAVVGLVIAYLTLRRASSSSSAQAATPATAAYSYPVIGQAGTGSVYGGYDPGLSSTDAIAGLSDGMAAISQQISTLSGALTPSGSTSSPVSSSGTVPTAGAVGATGGAQSIPGWEYLSNPGQGSTYFSAGRTIDVLPTGMAPNPANLVPYVSGGKVLNPNIHGEQFLQVA